MKQNKEVKQRVRKLIQAWAEDMIEDVPTPMSEVTIRIPTAIKEVVETITSDTDAQTMILQGLVQRLVSQGLRMEPASHPERALEMMKQMKEMLESNSGKRHTGDHRKCTISSRQSTWPAIW